jgi:hypothetical protein
MKNDAPMFGEYVKLLKTGEILKWKSYDPKNQMVEIELATGAVITVQRHEIDRITTDEELDFLRSREKSSGRRLPAN